MKIEFIQIKYNEINNNYVITTTHLILGIYI